MGVRFGKVTLNGTHEVFDLTLPSTGKIVVVVVFFLQLTVKVTVEIR